MGGALHFRAWRGCGMEQKKTGVASGSGVEDGT